MLPVHNTPNWIQVVAALTEGLPPYHSLRRSDCWKDTYLKNLITCGVFPNLLHQDPANPNLARETYSSGKEKIWGEEEIQKLWDQGCFIQLLPGIHPPPRMISTWFVDRRSGKPRLVVDLRPTNEIILDETWVRYEDLGYVHGLIEPGDVIWSLDIRSAYYGVSLHPGFIPYCCILFHNKILAATVMLLGLNVAPRIYTAITEIVVQKLRSHGIKIIRYLDDFLGSSKPGKVETDVKLTIEILNNHGFNINFKKSQLEPSHLLRHLGLIIDAKKRVFRIPLEKVVDIRNFCHAALTKKSLRLVSLQRLIGKIIAVKRAFRPVRRLTWSLFLDLTLSKATLPKERVHLSDQSQLDLRFIYENLSVMSEAPMDPPNKTMIICTDAAGRTGGGWGGFIPATGQMAYGVWPHGLRELDIQILEILATILTIIALSPRDVPLCLLSDNSSSIHYIHRSGGLGNHLMLRLTFLLFAITEQLNCPIVHSIWIPSNVNIIPDNLSRGVLPSQLEMERQWRSMSDTLKIGLDGWINDQDVQALTH